jgi:hypothetical protein
MYPFVMSSKEFPVGIPTYFEGFKDLIKDNLFGFVRAEITAPLNLKYPLLRVTQTIVQIVWAPPKLE